MLALLSGQAVQMRAIQSQYLLAAGACSFLAALLHLACIAGGPKWYLAMGAGERVANLAAHGSWRPIAITLFIATVLGVWGLYAWSGAGLLPRLPLLKFGLCAITAVYVLRGVAFPFLQPHFPGNSGAFWFWSSAICLAIGLLHLLGLRETWSDL